MQLRKFILLLLTLSLFTACGDQPHSQKVRSTEFSDHTGAGPDPKSEPTAEAGVDAPRFETAAPTPEQTQRQLEVDKRLHIEDRGQQVSIYQTPVEIRERVREQRPDLVVESGTGFAIEKPFLNISSQTSTMSFSAVLKVTGKADENIELKCAFDKTKSPWSCDNMYPADPAIAAQRRMQATVNCADHYRWELDSYPCEDVGIRIYVLVNGKRETQLFQTRKFSARVATSGDEEVEEHKTNLKPLDSPLPAGPRVQEKPGQQSSLQPIDPISAERPKVEKTDLEPAKTPADTPVETPLAPIDPISAARPKTKPTAPAPEVQPEESQPEESQPNSATASQIPLEEEEPIVFAPLPDEAEELSDDEIAEFFNDPSVALELTPPIPQPKPDTGPNSIPGIEQLQTEIGSDAPNQAQGSHNNGRLQSPTQLPDSSKGDYVCRNHGEKDFGAKIMIDLIQGAARVVKANNANKPPIVVATIAKRSGGCVTTSSGRCHSSHRNGLDVDIAFPSTRNHSDMWPACEASEQTRKVRRMGKMQNRSGTFCNQGGSISSRFDTKRFWELSKSFVCAEGEPVIAMFLDPEIKKHMCNYARNNGGIGGKGTCSYKILRAMKDEPGHFNHVHIRLRCPGNKGCRGQDSIVTLGDGTGC